MMRFQVGDSYNFPHAAIGFARELITIEPEHVRYRNGLGITHRMTKVAWFAWLHEINGMGETRINITQRQEERATNVPMQSGR